MVRRVYHDQLGMAVVKMFKMAGSIEHLNTQKKMIKEEIKLLASINHENVVRCHGWTSWQTCFAIVMDYVEGGTLSSFLQQQYTAPRFKVMFRMMHELSAALVYLHFPHTDQRMVHGDLKPGNIFLTLDLHVRVGDFGAASLATKTADRTHDGDNTNFVRTTAYTAPEFLLDPFKNKTTAMDVYSYGMVLYEMISKKKPYFHIGPDLDRHERNRAITDAIIVNTPLSLDPVTSVIAEMRSGEVDAYESTQGIVTLMQQCSAPTSRPTTKQIENFMFDVCRQFSPADVIMQVSEIVNQRRQATTRVPRQNGNNTTIDQINF